jgi:hypothetical protein
MFPKTSTFYKRSTLGKEAGKRLMNLTLSQNGDPLAQVQQDHRPHPIEDFNLRKIEASKKAAREAEQGTLGDKPATDARKTKEHFAPKKGK